MANTNQYKVDVEKWFREEYLPTRHPGCTISTGTMPLTWGGKFAYDGIVRCDDKIVAVYCLSCSEYKTDTGNGGSGKYNKIQGDILKMLGTDCPRKVLVFTGATMLEKVQSEQRRGRLPPDIQCELAILPQDLSTIVQQVSALSVREVTPEHKERGQQGVAPYVAQGAPSGER